MEEVGSVDGISLKNYDSFGQLVGTTRAGGLDETFSYDASGNRQVAGTIIGKGNRISYDGTFRYLYDTEGNLTEKTRVLMAQGSDIIQESTKYLWDNRNRLVRVEFYSPPGGGTAELSKTVEYVYNDSDHRISKKVTGTGQTAVSENYVWDGDQLVAVMNSTGTVTHQYFDAQSLDQVFADQTTVSGILWPVEDQAGTVRDVISTTGATLDHRTLSSFGSLTTQTGPAVDYDHFHSGMFWDSDSQLYYARARWYDPAAGRFIGEDPLGFEGGDLNVSRYANNDPVNFSDPTGLSKLGKFFHKAGDAIGDVVSDAGNFSEKQWDNGNIQKGLLVAGTLASGGMLGFGLAAGTLGTAEIFAGAMGVSSGLANSYEVFTGNRIGDGTFTQVLGATAAVTGGFFAPGVSSFGAFGRGLSGASGLVSGYEIASGNTIGDGTLSSLFHVSNLGVNHGSTLFNETVHQHHTGRGRPDFVARLRNERCSTLISAVRRCWVSWRPVSLHSQGGVGLGSGGYDPQYRDVLRSDRCERPQGVTASRHQHAMTDNRSTRQATDPEHPSDTSTHPDHGDARYSPASANLPHVRQHLRCR
jgi:RHS repeat-associated protein